jgi:transcriptional antiterminator RfaH
MSYWAVIQTEAQREHTARLLLMRESFETYAPRIRSKFGKVLLLFPTYLFVRIIDRWYTVAWTPGVTRVLMAGEQPAQLPEKIVEQIRKREVGGFVRLPSRVAQLRKGQQVRITRGSFQGQVGLYDGMTSHERQRVLLQLLGGWVPVELSANDVAPLNVA